MFRIRQIKYIGTPREWLKRGFAAKFLKPVLQNAVKLWHDKMLPRHFEAGAAQKYGYLPRAASTIKRKLRATGARGLSPDARLPLIWTGRLKREVTRMIRVSGTGKRGRGSMTGPPWLSYRPHLAKEVTAVTRKEAEEMAKYIKHLVVHHLNNDRTTTTVRP